MLSFRVRLVFVALCAQSGCASPAPAGRGPDEVPPASAAQTAVALLASSTSPDPSASSVASADARPIDWADESIGGLRAGVSEDEVVRTLGNPTSRSQPMEEGATSMFSSRWSWPGGVDGMMEATSAKAKAHLRLLVVAAPSKLRTSRGIGIGSTRREVDAAYGPSMNKDHSTPDFVLVGEMVGGLRVRLERGVVTSISIGSDGE